MNLHLFLKSRFQPLLEGNDRVYNLTGSSAAALLALAPGPFVAIEKDSQSAEILKKDIDFYTQLFPSPSPSPTTGEGNNTAPPLLKAHTLAAPSSLLLVRGGDEGEGVKCLSKKVLFMPEAEGSELAGQRAGIILNMELEDSLVTSFQNLYAGFWDKELLQEQLLQVRLKAQQDRLVFEKALVELGYRGVSMVTEKGQYSQRGWIIDVFPSTSEYPVRLEFFGDEIE
ncbi:MAG: hypothetical protein Q8K68_08365, partial [Nitrospirota bacterium]|nr:hypothetical protein [Nitrospirota bacterium]